MMEPTRQTGPHFDAAGPVNAPAILLVHGSVVTRKMWLPQLQGLAGEYRLIAPDLPGHGTMAQVPFTFDAAAGSLAELICQETAGRALVVGLSLGGYVAIELARRHPDRVAGLVLSGCSINFEGVLGLYLKLVSGLMRRGWLKQSYTQTEQKTRQMIPPALADVAEAQLQAGVYPEALGPAFAEMAGKDFTIPLGRYPGPVLILNGEKDSGPRRGEARFAAALQQGRVEIVPGAGHACNLDNVEGFNQAVRGFAQSIGWV
jgi:pimeloyl-ACP methyl ester carboxylesterase